MYFWNPPQNVRHTAVRAQISISLCQWRTKSAFEQWKSVVLAHSIHRCTVSLTINKKVILLVWPPTPSPWLIPTPWFNWHFLVDATQGWLPSKKMKSAKIGGNTKSSMAHNSPENWTKIPHTNLPFWTTFYWIDLEKKTLRRSICLAETFPTVCRNTHKKYFPLSFRVISLFRKN